MAALRYPWRARGVMEAARGQQSGQSGERKPNRERQCKVQLGRRAFFMLTAEGIPDTAGTGRRGRQDSQRPASQEFPL